MKKTNIYRAYIFIISGAFLWGMIGLFVKKLQSLGFTSMEVTAIRVISATIFLLLIGYVRFKDKLTIQLRHVPLFIGTGIFSIVFFNWSYFTAIEEMTISMAVILLYTAPAFVIVLSAIFLREKLTKKKALGVIGTIFGCFLITGVANISTANVTLMGIIVGLGSGLGYSLYTIFGKVALNYYHSFTITLYTFVTASIFMFPVTQLWTKPEAILRPDVLIFGLGLGLLPTVIAYLLYTEGLKYVDGSIAAILATIEPVVAVFLGVFAFNELLTTSQWIGAAVIVISVIYVNFTIKNRKNV